MKTKSEGEGKHPCLCDTCLKARDSEVARVRKQARQEGIEIGLKKMEGGERKMDETNEAKAIGKMKEAFELLKKVTVLSRENSLVLTKLEEAMMWCNKDRTIKGELPPNESHTPLGVGEKE